MPICASCREENPERARFCLACGVPLADENAAERRKLVTLLFCDVSGSTAMGERLDAESVRALMFRYFHEMRSAIERHGGTVEKFIGDAVVAVFGVPTAHEDDALRAVRAAAEMQERLAALNHEFSHRFGSRIALRIGVNTGEVVVGGATREEPFVSGDTANVAARLEQAASPGEILVGRQTHRLTRDTVSVEPVGPLEVKGKSDPLEAYRLVELPSADAPIVGRRLEGTLVGRAGELAFLQQAFERCVAERRFRFVSVLGQPGVGKSRLAHEFISSVAPGATVLTGRCLSYGEGITYWPLAEAVKQAAAVRDEDDSDRARQKIAALVSDEVDGATVTERIATASGLAEGQASAEEISWAVRRLLTALARTRPVVLVLEDLHWAESPLLDLVEAVASRGHSAQVLLLGLSRPELLERRPGWADPSDVAQALFLEPLPPADSSMLIEQVLGGKLAGVTDRLIEASGGNPLFVEELVSMLIDDGLVERVDGEWRPVADIAAIPIPPTVDALVESRLDALESPERAAIERAAVEGQVFHRGAVEALSSPDTRAGVREAVQSLVEREFVLSESAVFSGEAAFRFRHVLIRDVAYRSTPKRLRAEFHAQFADWLVQKASRRITEVEEIVGYHFEQAYHYLCELGPVGPEQRALASSAAMRLEAGGNRALSRSDFDAAINMFERAASLRPADDPDRLMLLPRLGSALTEAGRLDDAEAVLDEAIRRSRALGDERVEVNALVERLVLRLQLDAEAATRQAREIHDRAQRVLEEYRDDRGLCGLWNLKALVHWHELRCASADQAWRKAATYARRAGDRRKLDDVLSWLASSAFYGPVPADGGIRRCEEIRKQLRHDRGAEAHVLLALAALNAMTAEPGLARRLVAESDEVVEDLGLTMYAAAPHREAFVAMMDGDFVEAERRLRDGFNRLSEMGEKALLSTTAALLADALCAQGRYEDALPFTEVSEAESADSDLATQIGWRAVRARIFARRNRIGEAEGLARAAVELAERTDCLTHHADASLALAEVLELDNQVAESREALTEALRLFEEKGNLVEAERARCLLANLASV